MLEHIKQFILDHHCFAVTSHSRPDGDALGSELGLMLGLEKLGKKAHIFNADPHPHTYSRLPGIDRITITDRLEGAFDGVFVLECNDLDRPGLKNLDRYFVINIDHHLKTEAFGNINWIDPAASAVGEMIFELLKNTGVQLDARICANLYVALLTDTGSFQFSNTRPHTFQVASELVSHGVDPAEIAQTVYMSQPYSKIRLLASILNTLELHPFQQIAWIFLDHAMLRKAGASEHETEGIVNYPLSIDGVVIAVFFREDGRGGYRVSLRSKNDYDVAAIAQRFGGGGHKNAAGFSLKGNWNEVNKTVISALEGLLTLQGPAEH
ncbi:MAG: bifunctional oligoribonuclease/PAP phosphatase NrnA [Acidobacteria bacterium]|nr:bifunctional oligoribonuclease/PAP phosphatase NrnA [Acidobacteriota bacterium]